MCVYDTAILFIKRLYLYGVKKNDILKNEGFSLSTE